MTEELLDRYIKSIDVMMDEGKEGCTYNDTEMSSIDVVYGYNLALSHVKDMMLKELNNIK